jgi:hypothetical protein
MLKIRGDEIISVFTDLQKLLEEGLDSLRNRADTSLSTAATSSLDAVNIFC